MCVCMRVCVLASPSFAAPFMQSNYNKKSQLLPLILKWDVYHTSGQIHTIQIDLYTRAEERLVVALAKHLCECAPMHLCLHQGLFRCVPPLLLLCNSFLGLMQAIR